MEQPSKFNTRWWFQIFIYFHPYLGKIPILTNIFQMGWNHQLEQFAPENGPGGPQKATRTGSSSKFQASIFRGEVAVSFKGGCYHW